MKRIGVFLVILISLVGTAAQAAEHKLVGGQTLSGQLHVIWGDSDGTTGPRETVRFGLIGADGSWTELDVADVPGADVLSMNRQRVALEGQWQSSGPQAFGLDARGTVDAKFRFRVKSIKRDSTKVEPMAAPLDMQPMAVTGTQKWVTILCRFSDFPDTPRERGWFESLMLGNTYPRMSHYWNELSFGQLNLTGNQVAGWYNLPRPQSYYAYDIDGDGKVDLDFGRAVQDCAALADNEVYFPNFEIVNCVLNGDIGAWGGSWPLELDGQWKGYGATWVSAGVHVGQEAWAHETGHALGLPHSSGQYSQTYDSPWDVMSGSWAGCAFSDPDPVFWCVGQHTIAWHKAMMGLFRMGGGFMLALELPRRLRLKIWKVGEMGRATSWPGFP